MNLWMNLFYPVIFFLNNFFMLQILDFSCIPNSVLVFEGRVAFVRAVEPIANGTEVSLQLKLHHQFLLLVCCNWVIWLLIELLPVCKVLISYIETAATTKTRQNDLKRQYFFTCNCPRCTKVVLDILVNFSATYFYFSPLLLAELRPRYFLLTLFCCQFIQSPYEELKENALLEGYKCKDDKCNGFLLYDAGSSSTLNYFITVNYVTLK